MKLKTIRTARNYSVDQLADLAGVDPEIIRAIEDGQNITLTTGTIVSIANALSVGVMDIID